MEEKYKDIILKYELEMGFYFSYSYDLTNPLSKNMLRNSIPLISKHKDYD